MSYLNALRLHFAGRFQANVSTVNNDPTHFDNATFKPSYQKRQGPDGANGWFNPQGDAAWRLLGCSVTSAWTPTGAVGSGDPVLGYVVADSDTRAPAKLVDLDSQQQLVSEIWGLQVRIATADGATVLVGDFEPAAFIDIWDRSTASSGGDTIAGAMYQSVLRNLEWGDVSDSAFLTALQQAAKDDLLSIKFNVDSFNLDFRSPDFMTGRIVGTIGPAEQHEPQHLVVGRQFMATSARPPGNFFKPKGGINFCVGVVDPAAGCIYLDLGNALSTGTGDTIDDLGDLTLSVVDPPESPTNPAGGKVPIGTIPSTGTGGYTDAAWYPRTAGVVVLPVSAALLPLVQRSPLVLSGRAAVITEAPNAAFVRADRYVYRLAPGDTVEISVYAMQWGRPLVGAVVVFPLDPSQLQPVAGLPVATPTTALDVGASAVTDGRGIATLTLGVTDPGSPRTYIDGQVYGIRPGFADTSRYGGPVNDWNFVSLLLWSGFTASNPPTWDDVQPIFQQYANLYPVMNRFLDLGDYDSVVANTRLLQLAFGLDPADPNAMPVTRDLSPAKRATILAWLQNPLPGSAPRSAAVRAATPAAVEVAAGAGSALAAGGGKAAAMSRRLVLRAEREEQEEQT